MSPYLKIIRLPNLLIIILTQVLLRICIIGNFYSLSDVEMALSNGNFVLLVIATVLIAAGGYVINDYFDEEVDKINKPNKLICGNLIKRPAVMMYYWTLTLPGVLFGMYLALMVNYFILGFIFVAIAIMLYLYSQRYKQRVLIGNLLISILSAMVVLIVWIFEFYSLQDNLMHYVEVMKYLKFIGNIVLGYTLFAFLVSFIREILKDIEDIKGDQAAEYRTLPIAKGIVFSKKLAMSLLIFVIIVLGVTQYLLWTEQFHLVFWYFLVALQPLLLYVFFQTKKAKVSEDFQFLSNAMKVIMVAGILSMQLFYVSF
ncbi:MAG: geranylgeranylglycerol-phosphate geranylgeranyltransferase [Bacteroidales bacterium]